MQAHELIAALNPNSADWSNCVQADKFDLGELDEVHSLADLGRGDFHEIPSPLCLFQISKERDIYMLLAVDQGDRVEWKVFTKIAATGSAWQGITQEVSISKDGFVSLACPESGDIDLNDEEALSRLPDHRAWALVQTLKVARSIEVFSCCNVQRVEHLPPKLINQKRIKKGKTPFYSYKTLHIAGEGSSGSSDQPESGSHASPRLHLRRGHIRRLPSGVRVWVNSCLVGDKSKGMVTKDYRVTA